VGRDTVEDVKMEDGNEVEWKGERECGWIVQF